jgi:hypothetical protein
MPPGAVPGRLDWLLEYRKISHRFTLLSISLMRQSM